MVWVYRDAWLDGGIATFRLENAADAETVREDVPYVGTGNPATDPAFTLEVRDRIESKLRVLEAMRLRRVDATQRFRPRPTQPGAPERDI